MQVLPSSHARWSLGAMRSIAGGTFVGATLLVIGLAIGYLAFATSFIHQFTSPGRPGPQEAVTGAVAWAVAITAPAGFVILGLARLMEMLARLTSLRTSRGPLSRFADAIPDAYVAAARVRLPDGQVVPELVVGPHGIAIFEELPPGGATRHKGHRWEIRLADGRWLPVENPLDRAARDAERVRRWMCSDDRDFVVKVYAAVIAPDTSLPRTPNCAVITRDQVPAFLASLPVQRSLTAIRLTHVVRLIRDAV